MTHTKDTENKISRVTNDTNMVYFAIGLRGVSMKFPGMILLLYLKGTMRLDRSKDMSVHICFNFHKLL